ncbi:MULTISPECIES: type IV secretion system ATPase VirD4 [unclassified Neorhizobium]|uniref:type IV secretion system ATPase VirD4 n=1 Tax=unclassified Neorhizobium TaxID=2629175 RepID=UPI001FF45386|nr:MULTISPECIES: type IV secretion system ATPase VirD4 [unclassified Neorhizobium]MCJ9670405.1 type IV secretion system ATPase VirD4 [Neorhizobium sp. SHOUNA12B]MCJ9746283.1 type IV secretion system ATPase VirD4 [Neorhizobium sp. SHOUNA12A]
MHNKRNTLLYGFALSLIVGLFFATLYAGFQRGISAQTIDEFDILSFWYETPFHKGYVTPVFIRGLMTIGVTAVIITLVITIVVLRQHDDHGTARWAGFGELAAAGYIKPYGKINGPIFGKTSGPRGFGRYLTNGDQPHSLVVAPTRAGKGVGIVIPTLLTFDGSILALDVKGELFEMTSRSRLARGDRVYKFAPFDPSARTHSYNPVLDIVEMPPERRFSETRRLAYNLIAPKGKGSEGFIDGARDLLVAGILACIERGTPSIGAVYDLFSQPGEKYKLFAQLAEETQNVEAQRIFDNMAGNDTKILTSYTSVLGDGGLNLWADPRIKAATVTSDFSIYDLRRDPTSIFICVSPNDLEVIAPLVRLFFQQVVSILQRSMPQKDEIFEVLFLLDEFKHLGKLESIETAVTTIAGYKGRFMFIIQSLAALTGAYEEAGKENFLSNTGIQVFMATADDETPNYISKAIGDYSYRERSKSYSTSNMFDTNIQISNQGAPLMRPEQVRLMDDQTQIVLIKGQPPLKMHKVKYYSDRILKRLFEAQTGPLPEPEPLGGQLIAPVSTVQQTAPPVEVPSTGVAGGQYPNGEQLPQMYPPVPAYQNADYEEETHPPDAPAGASESSGGNGSEWERYEETKRPVNPAYEDPYPTPSGPTEAELKALAAQRALLDRIIALQRNSDASKSMGLE